MITHDVRSLLIVLPHLTRGFDIIAKPNAYPVYAHIAAVLQPKRVLEIGTNQGCGLISFMFGHPGIRQLQWVDNESWTNGSNEMARKNIEFACREMSWTEPAVQYSQDNDGISYQHYDLVHIDGEHTYDGALLDMYDAWEMKPRVMIVHDYLNTRWPQVERAVEFFARDRELDIRCWGNGAWAVLSNDATIPDQLP